MNNLASIFPDVHKPLIGMVHLKPLPGAPLYDGDVCAVMAAAVRDARALVEGGVHGLMIENFGDVPFHAGPVGPETIAFMTAVARQIRQQFPVPLGINVLRNDGCGALAVALACEASFIRVNVLAGVSVTDQGLISGEAAKLMRKRRELGAEKIAVWADVRVKHAAPLVTRALEEEVEELRDRALADAVVVSGSGTGRPVDMDRLRGVRQAAGAMPVIVGSGADGASLAQLAACADAVIVGSSLKYDGVATAAVDRDRVAALMAAWRRMNDECPMNAQ